MNKRSLALYCSGCFFILGGAFLTLALLSFNPNDPSFNLASHSVTANWMGSAGAYISAPLLSLFGLGNILWIAPFIWGIELLLYRKTWQLWLLIPAFIFSIIGLSAMSTGLDNLISLPISWPSSSFGGYIGNLLQFQLDKVLPPLGWWGLTALITLPLMYYVLRTNPEYVYNFVMRIVSYVDFIYHRILRRIFNLLFRRHAREEMNTPKPAVRVERKKRTDATKQPRAREQKPRQQSINFKGTNGAYELPPLDLLESAPERKQQDISDHSLEQNARLLERTLDDFGVKGNIVEISPGPVVTLYALEPAPGTKSSRVVGLADDIARSMSSKSARIAVIPGRNAIGIELPNSTRETVYLRELIETKEFETSNMMLPLALGKDIGGESVIIDMARTPHLLVAGTTGSGKSVGVNAMILSLLYRFTPEECKFIMIDPKMLELSIYQDIPHLLAPVVTEPGKAVVALKWVVREMESRYRLMSNLNVRNIQGYNEKLKKAGDSGQQLTRTVQTGFDKDTGQPIIETIPLDTTPLPYIVVIVDEMADLMLVAGKDIEGSVQRLAQMARAAGIHIILATQRPSVDVITGVIKANFPSRISFQVTSKIDSRTILGDQGAEQLLGQGDMLYMSGGNRIVRVHGPFVGDREVENIVNFLKSQGSPSYVEDVTAEPENADGMAGLGGGDGSGNALYDQAVSIVLRDKKASTSYIQRMLKIGYNRAASLMDEMERNGVVGPANHVGKREILMGE